MPEARAPPPDHDAGHCRGPGSRRRTWQDDPAVIRVNSLDGGPPAGHASADGSGPGSQFVAQRCQQLAHVKINHNFSKRKKLDYQYTGRIFSKKSFFEPNMAETSFSPGGNTFPSRSEVHRTKSFLLNHNFIEKATDSRHVRAAHGASTKFSKHAKIHKKFEELIFRLGSKMMIRQKNCLAASLLMYRKEERLSRFTSGS